jgi:hypothetical protein
VSDAVRFRLYLSKGDTLGAIAVDERRGWLRVTRPAWRLEEDLDARTAQKVQDGITVRTYPAGAIRYVEDLEPPEAGAVT